VASVRTAAAAVALCAAVQFDVLVCDLWLADGSGLDVMAALQRHWPGTPAVMVTADGLDAQRRAAQAAGFAEYLLKPVDVATIEAAIRRATSRRTPAGPTVAAAARTDL
jgi:DNA-binding NarL/FixJ family response regulator